MKLKEDIVKWKNEVKELKLGAENLESNVIELSKKVAALTKITEEMTETMLALVRQQIGD